MQNCATLTSHALNAASRRGLPTMLVLAGALVAGACGSTSRGSQPPSGAATASASQVPGSVLPLATAAAAASASPSVPPQPAGRLAFDRYDVAFGAEAPLLGSFVTASDGTDEHALTLPAATIGLLPVWSPDGRRLLVALWTPPTGPVTSGVMNVDGSGLVVFDPPGVDGDLGCTDWSPDGELLACYVSGFAPAPDGIYTLRSDGTDLVRLTTAPFHHAQGTAGECGGGDSRGVFSRDGSQIAFIRQRCGTGANPSSDESAAIEVVNRDGTGLREILPQGGVKSHPGSQLSWSPDGTRIALGSQSGELFLVHPDGTGLTQIPLPTDLGSHHAYGPDWSPEGTRIVFSMYVDAKGSTDLYSIAPDGSNLVQITQEDGAENYASWGPPAP
jgi:Tol biopolymer transport system component